MTRAEKAERERALRALDFMHLYPGAGRDPDDNDRARADATARRLGMRPLKPPPVVIPERQVSASRLALAKDRKKGIVRDARPLPTRDPIPSQSWFELRDRR